MYFMIESKKSFEIDGNVANVGDMLHAREYRNISVELLAAKLNLEPKIIRKIEGIGSPLGRNLCQRLYRIIST